jgi:hypothetical protein
MLSLQKVLLLDKKRLNRIKQETLKNILNFVIYAAY